MLLNTTAYQKPRIRVIGTLDTRHDTQKNAAMANAKAAISKVATSVTAHRSGGAAPHPSCCDGPLGSCPSVPGRLRPGLPPSDNSVFCSTPPGGTPQTWGGNCEEHLASIKGGRRNTQRGASRI